MHSAFSGLQESCVYLRESSSQEIVPFAIQVRTTDVIRDEVRLIELCDSNTLNEIGEQAQKNQPDYIVEQTDISTERWKNGYN
jgi:hypothetical protein